MDKRYTAAQPTMTRSATALLVLLLSLGIAAQQRPFGETIEVKLIEIDVIVTDAGGKRIHGLTRADFEVFEDRRQQTISNFTEYRRPAAPDDSAIPATTSAPEPRSLLVLIDSLPREALVRSTAFRTLEPLVAKLMREGDRGSVVFWEPGFERARTILEPTSDAQAVRRAIRALGGVSTAEAPSESDAQDAAAQFLEAAQAEMNAKGAAIDIEGHKESGLRFAGAMDLLHFRRKTRAMGRLVTSFAAGLGRKSVLYVSHSFGMPTEPGARLSALALVEDLAKTANTSGVTFYAIHPAPPDEENGGNGELQRQLDSLRHLTDPTGGLLDFGLRSVETLGAMMAADLDSYYSIAYRARSAGRDRERRIVVKPKDRRYRVRARQSFVEKSNETLARDAVIVRLFAGDGGDDLRFEVAERAPRSAGRGKWHLPIVVKIPAGQLEFAQEGPDQVALVKILIVASNGIAEVTAMHEDDLRVVAGRNTVGGLVGYSAELLVDSRGSEVAIGVFDRRSGLVGVRTLDSRERFR